MRSAVYKKPLYIKRGDTYISPVIRLQNLTPYGGPATLEGATLTARMVKASGQSDPVPIEVVPVDLAARRIRLKILATVTENIPFSSGTWDIHVDTGDWEGTPLQGTAEMFWRATA